MDVFGCLLAEFDLEKEKSILDEQGLRIAENQENSQKNRRKLAESTRGMPFYFLTMRLSSRGSPFLSQIFFIKVEIFGNFVGDCYG